MSWIADKPIPMAFPKNGKVCLYDTDGMQLASTSVPTNIGRWISKLMEIHSTDMMITFEYPDEDTDGYYHEFKTNIDYIPAMNGTTWKA
jgi:hypothetical protein